MYDQKINNAKFEIGDAVVLMKEPKDGKFDIDYNKETCTIKKKIDDFNFEIHFGNGKTKIVHPNKLKHFTVRY